METSEALRIVRALADGTNPATGEPCGVDSVFQQIQTVRALEKAVAALESEAERCRRRSHLPAKVGKPWLSTEEEQLCAEFDRGMSIREIARLHGRLCGGITARLEKLRKVPCQATMNFLPASGGTEVDNIPPIQNAEHRDGKESLTIEPDRPWMPVEDARICKDFWRLDLGQIANSLRRPRLAVYSRLVYLGKISPNGHSSAT